LQLFRAQQKIIYRYEIKEGKKIYETTINGKKWSMYDDTAIGYDQKGNEVVRLNVEEPMIIREAKRVNSI
jgi:hypothetical protein